jgi:sugar phosphate isomerase/epimerase
VHLSDTPREVYRHSAVGEGVVQFAQVPPLLEEVGYRDLPMLEIIADDPDQAIRASVERLFALGWPRRSAGNGSTAPHR